MPESPAEMVSESDDEISLLDLALVVAENIRLLLFGPLLIGVLAFGIASLLPKEYTATTRLMPPSGGGGASAALASALGSLGGLAGSVGGLSGLAKSPADQAMGLMKSRTLEDRVIDRFKLRDRYDVETYEDARKALAANVVIAVQAKEGLVTVAATDRDPQVAAEIANAYVDELRKMMRTIAITEAGQRRLFFEEQVRTARQALDQAEDTLKATGVGETALKLAPQAMLAQAAQLKAQIAAQEIKIASMRGYVADASPDLRQARQELASMRAQWGELRRQGEADEPGGAAAGYAAKYREFKYQETLFELMAKQLELARLDEARDGSVVQVVDVAIPPERKSKPKRALIAVIASLAGGFLLLLFVFVRRAFQQTAQSAEGLAKLRAIRQAMGWRGAA